MITPTYEEWQAARERLRGIDTVHQKRVGSKVTTRLVGNLDNLTVAALGPCPPEPAPPPHSVDGRLAVTQSTDGLVRTDYVGEISPDEADVMAAALVDHARYAREQEDNDEPICGRLRAGYDDLTKPLCVRPKGHTGACKAASA